MSTLQSSPQLFRCNNCSTHIIPKKKMQYKPHYEDNPTPITSIRKIHSEAEEEVIFFFRATSDAQYPTFLCDFPAMPCVSITLTTGQFYFSVRQRGLGGSMYEQGGGGREGGAMQCGVKGSMSRVGEEG